MVTVERVTEGAVLGEGPHWDIPSQSLYFVDIFGKSILRYVPSTKKLTKASFEPRTPSFIIPVEGQQKFIVGAGSELLLISWDGESEKFTIDKTLSTVEKNPKAPNKGFNDAKCDSTGRLWAGTHNSIPDFMKTEPLGTLYTFDATNHLKNQLEGIRISNGLAFNDAKKKMYFIDSLKGSVDQFDFDINNGTISNRQVWFTLKQASISGIPDGMTIDTNGNLWVAVFGGGVVLKVDGSKPETLLDSIKIPAEQVTSVAFGGPELDELYVTTGALEVEGKKLSPPENGATYKVTGTGSTGYPAANFKLN